MQSLGRSFALFAILFTLVLQPSALQNSPSQQDGGSASTSNSKANSSKPNCTNNGAYVNSKGQAVPRPENCSAPPQRATAQCRDGSYSSRASDGA